MNNKIRNIVLLFLAGAMVPILLFFSLGRPNEKRQKFTRNMILSPAKVLKTSAVIGDAYRLADYSGNTAVISLLYPGDYLVVDSTLTIREHHSLHYPFTDKNHTSYQLDVVYPYAYLLIGNKRKIFKIDMQKDVILDSIRVPYVFLRSVKGGGENFGFRCFDTVGKHPLVWRWMSVNNQMHRPQVAGPVSASKKPGTDDGLLNYYNGNQRYIYTQFFTGGIQELDSNLNLQASFPTIDSTNFNNTLSGDVKVGAHLYKYTSLSPKYVVNYNSTVSGDKLYVQCLIKAENQSEKTFTENFNIDVYDLAQKKYLFSFYIPKLSEQAIVDFKVFGSKILVLFPDHLKLYRIPLNNTKGQNYMAVLMANHLNLSE